MIYCSCFIVEFLPASVNLQKYMSGLHVIRYLWELKGIMLWVKTTEKVLSRKYWPTRCFLWHATGQDQIENICCPPSWKALSKRGNPREHWAALQDLYGKQTEIVVWQTETEKKNTFGTWGHRYNSIWNVVFWCPFSLSLNTEENVFTWMRCFIYSVPTEKLIKSLSTHNMVCNQRESPLKLRAGETGGLTYKITWQTGDKHSFLCPHECVFTICSASSNIFNSALRHCLE